MGAVMRVRVPCCGIGCTVSVCVCVCVRVCRQCALLWDLGSEQRAHLAVQVWGWGEVRVGQGVGWGDGHPQA